MATRNHAIKALALDAFGTVIQYGQRLAPYSRLLAERGEGGARLPFLTRDVPVATFAAELGLEHLLPDIKANLEALRHTPLPIDDADEERYGTD